MRFYTWYEDGWEGVYFGDINRHDQSIRIGRSVSFEVADNLEQALNKGANL